MGGAGHDVETALAFHQPLRVSIEFDHLIIETADDEQCGRLDARQRLSSKVRAPAARDDGRDARFVRRGDERGRGAGARAEEADGQIAKVALRRPGDRLPYTRAEQRDVEDIAAVVSFFARQ